MQAILEKSARQFSVTATPSITEIIDRLETVDNVTKNELENTLVRFGKDAVPTLIDQLQLVRGVKRGVVAMTLIRIGEDSIEYLKRAAKINKDFEWVANYLITEIKGVA